MKTIVLCLFCVFLIYGFLRPFIQRAQERHRERLEWLIEEQERQEKEQARLAKEQAKQAREQERQRKEQERQAKALVKQAEQLEKLKMRLATAESEIAFGREQRERLFELLDVEEQARDEAAHGGKEWAKHQRKIISLENQIHTVQRRLDRAKMEKAFCNKKMAS